MNSRVLDTVQLELMQPTAAGGVSETESSDSDTRQSFCVVVPLTGCPAVVVARTFHLVVVVVVAEVVVVVDAVAGRRAWRHDPRDVWRRAFEQ